jgi:hypothetical protein
VDLGGEAVPVLEGEHVDHEHDAHLHTLFIVLVHCSFVSFQLTYFLDVVVTNFGIGEESPSEL